MENQTSWREEHFHDDVDAGVLQLLQLPDSGMGYFTLTDASILYALDDWWGRNRSNDPDFWDYISEKEPRQHIHEKQKTIEQLLIRAVERKELDATVFLRDVSTSLPIPLYTYAKLPEIKDCLETYGIWPGHMIDCADNLDTEGLYRRASEIARNRVAIRVGAPPDLDESLDDKTIDELRDEIAAKRMRIAKLEHELAQKSGASQPLGGRERATLLNIIGVLLDKCVKKDEPLIEEIQTDYPTVPGLRPRTLQAKFAEARRSLKSN